MVIWMFLLLKKNQVIEKKVKTYSKLESKIDDVINFVKKRNKRRKPNLLGVSFDRGIKKIRSPIISYEI